MGTPVYGSPVSVPRVAATYVALHSVLFAIHWARPVPILSELVPNATPIGLANPLLFIAVAIALWAAAGAAAGPSTPTLARRATSGCAILLVVFPAVSLLASDTGLPLGFDAVLRSTSQSTSAIRLSPNAAVAFLLTGSAFLLFRRPFAGWRMTAFAACALSVAFIGLAGLAGHLLSLEALYRLPTFNRILLPTAIAFAVVGAGLWGLHESVQEVPLLQIEGRIARRTLGVITLVALASGVAGFAVMRDNFEASISKNLQLTANTAATSLAHTIDTGLLFPKTISSRTALAEALEKLADVPGDVAARAFVQRVANNIVGAPLSRVEFYSASGAPVAQVGTSVRAKFAVNHPLKGEAATLGWDQGYVLVAEQKIHRDGRQIGWVLTEQKLPLFDQLLENVRFANETSDAAVCSIEGQRAVCAPTRFRGEAFSIPLYDPAGQPAFPIVRALLGQSGVQGAKDPRGIDVVSAYVPLDRFGLGLAFKTDVSTLYAPLRSRLALLTLSLAGIVALSIYALRSQVRPVVGRLADSERSLKAMLEEQAELVSLAKPNGELTYVNPAYARHYGLAPEQMLGQNLFDHVHPDDRDAVQAAVASVLDTGKVRTHENRIVRSDDGGLRWIAWTNSRQLDRSGLPMLHSVGRDVTERKQAEVALLESQAMLARTGRIAGVGGWELDLRTDTLLWTEETRRILEVDADFVPTLATALAFYTPESQEILRAAVQSAVTRGVSWDLELSMMTAKGRRIWARTQGQALREGGLPVRLVGAFQDITDRKELEQRLASSERFMRGIADNVPALVAYIDREQRYTFANAQFAERLGIDPAGMIGRSVRELRPEFYDEVLAPHLNAALRGEARTFDGKSEIDGRAVHYRVSYVPDIDAYGGTRGCYSLTVDITAVREAEQAALMAQQRLTEAIEALPAGFELYDVEDRLIIVNSTMKALYPQIADLMEQRLTFGQLVRANWERGGIHVPDNDIDRWIAERQRQRRTGGSSRTHQLAGGRWVRAFDMRTQEGGVVGVRIEITELIERDRELARLNKELQLLADTDPLTLTANRRLFDRRLAEAFAEAGAQGSRVAVVMFDIDYFKRFNDHHGHLAGDSCLRRVGAILRAALRSPDDLVARLGGEEFAVLLPGADADGASAMVRRCMDLLEDAAISHGDSPLGPHVTFSAGLAIMHPGDDAQRLMARADAALYRAKVAGRARWHATL